MSTKGRIDTIRLIAGQNQALSGSAQLNAIVGECNRILTADRFNKNYGWLLKVLHTTRALDTSLKQVISHKGWNSTSDLYSLGAYLLVLTQHGVLSENQRKDFQKSVVDKRNKYMHEAGAMPNKLEADAILNEMHSCLVFVLSNT